jgi:hypothetical protein
MASHFNDIFVPKTSKSHRLYSIKFMLKHLVERYLWFMFVAMWLKHPSQKVSFE